MDKTFNKKYMNLIWKNCVVCCKWFCD